VERPARDVRISAYNSGHRRKKNLPAASGMSSELFADLLRWGLGRPNGRIVGTAGDDLERNRSARRYRQNVASIRLPRIGFAT